MVQIEKQVLDYLASGANQFQLKSHRCDDNEKYSVYLIDNFDEKATIVPEIRISHGELVHKLLLSGREDIQVTLRNTSLSRGLASVLDDLKNGRCADAVLSSIPGSNYSYQQVSSMLPGDVVLSPGNILDHKEPLLARLGFQKFARRTLADAGGGSGQKRWRQSLAGIKSDVLRFFYSDQSAYWNYLLIG